MKPITKRQIKYLKHLIVACRAHWVKMAVGIVTEGRTDNIYQLSYDEAQAAIMFLVEASLRLPFYDFISIYMACLGVVTELDGENNGKADAFILKNCTVKKIVPGMSLAELAQTKSELEAMVIFERNTQAYKQMNDIFNELDMVTPTLKKY